MVARCTVSRAVRGLQVRTLTDMMMSGPVCRVRRHQRRAMPRQDTRRQYRCIRLGLSRTTLRLAPQEMCRLRSLACRRS